MSTTLERLEYGFDRDSRRTWRRRALATGEDNAYGYDGLSQVINAARGNLNLNATAIGGVPAEDEAWDYDPTGNWHGYRVEENGAVTLEQQRVHDKGNRLMQIEGSAETVLVDRAGRMVHVPPDAGGDWSEPLELVWDAWSRLVEVRQGGSAVGDYAYDGLSRRTTRTTGGVTWHTYYSDAWRPLEERQDSQATAAKQYYWGARHRDDLVRRDRATTSGGSLNETRYVLMDYFSPAAITDGSGNVTERYAFSAFGVRRIMAPDFSSRTSSECDFEFGFQGQFLDTESGFYDYGYRYYSPSLGRWTCKDPMGEDGGGNLYAILDNNAVNIADLLGLAPASSSGVTWQAPQFSQDLTGGTIYPPYTGANTNNTSPTTKDTLAVTVVSWDVSPTCKCSTGNKDDFLLTDLTVSFHTETHTTASTGTPYASIIKDEYDHILDYCEWTLTEATQIVQKNRSLLQQSPKTFKGEPACKAGAQDLVNGWLNNSALHCNLRTVSKYDDKKRGTHRMHAIPRTKNRDTPKYDSLKPFPFNVAP